MCYNSVGGRSKKPSLGINRRKWLSIIESDMIRKSIEKVINEQIKQNKLKEQLLEFVDYQSKQGFPFGELLVLHYNQFNGTETEEIYLVAAVEILILSFDMLDDFEDDDFKDKPWSTESNLALNATTALLF